MFSVVSAARRARPLVVTLILGAVAAPLLDSALVECFRRLLESRTGIEQGNLAARARVFGGDYTAAVEELRREIPPEGTYVLVDGSGGEDRHLFLRYELAPRRALLLGRLVGARRDFVVEGRPPDVPATVVMARGAGVPPDVIPAERFFEGMPVFDPGREDLSIPVSLERPVSGESVRGALPVVGWCQERGGRACSGVRFFVDAREVSSTVERFPRPDVEGAVRGIGSADRAGFRTTLAPPAEGGAHALTIYGQTSDGRYRRLGPRVFTWGPE